MNRITKESAVAFVAKMAEAARGYETRRLRYQIVIVEGRPVDVSPDLESTRLRGESLREHHPIAITTATPNPERPDLWDLSLKRFAKRKPRP